MVAVMLWFVIVADVAIGWKIAAVFLYAVGTAGRMRTEMRLQSLEKWKKARWRPGDELI